MELPCAIRVVKLALVRPNWLDCFWHYQQNCIDDSDIQLRSVSAQMRARFLEGYGGPFSLIGQELIYVHV